MGFQYEQITLKQFAHEWGMDKRDYYKPTVDILGDASLTDVVNFAMRLARNQGYTDHYIIYNPKHKTSFFSVDKNKVDICGLLRTYRDLYQYHKNFYNMKSFEETVIKADLLGMKE